MNLLFLSIYSLQESLLCIYVTAFSLKPLFAVVISVFFVMIGLSFCIFFVYHLFFTVNVVSVLNYFIDYFILLGISVVCYLLPEFQHVSGFPFRSLRMAVVISWCLSSLVLVNDIRILLSCTLTDTNKDIPMTKLLEVVIMLHTRHQK